MGEYNPGVFALKQQGKPSKKPAALDI